MKFISILSLFFAVSYALIAIHYMSFDRDQKLKLIDTISNNTSDIWLSLSFISKDYEGFVYDK
ncbi:hypothetical protein [Campylobacter hyointestinalis]|uniref:hypothetical protein n=1 Tax=Campylobacter hyointestinalis TaxID=198 RepID=UPI00072450D0|nr:hypothetical protein [Campylobacter hyointestinalis]PPB54184.1 hypothetical protein CDQ69_04835 [Campylobacter hyointestinalis subsp. hyointestinalis]PPB61339.1 hypothetical protein CDQ72_05305 [Campylobacter hyointestinalis subsp. hyointestinalis]PPB61625.1 hypothetical protein CDQ73_07865 [Campylobacter hyointestinalis subsp. hyointestinalis]CUU73398.1 Uncharacterised protein [Campylobacter hyointestinalis subsp. hyointestinalis]CUU76151.1 Uncharacterised protein [Campylobacter hyointesti